MELKFMTKKRILFIGEASFLNTGFSNYYAALLPRLVATNKYELAEIGCIPADFRADVRMDDEYYKPLCEVKKGDRVRTHTAKSRKVTDTMGRWVENEDIYCFKTHFGNEIHLTGNHQVLMYSSCVDKRKRSPIWVRADQLSIGDYFTSHPIGREETDINITYDSDQIIAINVRKYTGVVLNLEVKKDNSYTINNIICHNSYAHQSDPRVYDFIKNRWKFYGVMPETPEEQRKFNDPANQSPRCPGQNTWQFGHGIFDRVCAEFKPDVVCDIRDNWMITWLLDSQFIREKYTKLIFMPTVDSHPQKEEWINDYRNVNLCLSYSDFGIDTLMRYGGIKLYNKPMRPGVELDLFKPMDQIELKKDWLGCKDDVKVITCCMRNQSRKLFPDAIDAFAILKERYKGTPVVDKSVLVLHSSWPDNPYSYDYPRHIERMHNGWHGLQYYSKNVKNSVFNSFMCHDCGHVFLSWAINLYNKPVENRGRGPKIYINCQKCGKKTATTPDTSTGYTREQLARLYAMSDIFLQVSIAEGCSIPIQEAKACGTMCLVTDYSAMSEKGRFPSEYMHLRNVKPEDYTVNRGGDVIPVGRYYYEPETSCRRAHPDVNVMADLMYKYLIDDELRIKMGEEARQCAIDNYDWDKTAKEWEYILDNIKIRDRSEVWDKPHVILPKPDIPTIPLHLNEGDFVDFCYLKILKYPKVDPAGKDHWLNVLKGGANKQQVYDAFVQIVNREINEKNKINELLAAPGKSEDELGGDIV